MNNVDKMNVIALLDFKAELSYYMEISSLLIDLKDCLLSNFLTEELNSQ